MHPFLKTITLYDNVNFDFSNAESTIDYLIFITEPNNYSLIVQNLIMLGGKDKIKLFLKENTPVRGHSIFTKCNLALIPFDTIFIDNELNFVFESFLFDESIGINKRRIKINNLINNINELLKYISNETGYSSFNKIERDDVIIFVNSFKKKFPSSDFSRINTIAEFPFSDYSNRFPILINNLILYCIAYRFEKFYKKLINRYDVLLIDSNNNSKDLVNEEIIRPTKTGELDIIVNPHPRIFKNNDAFLLFEKLKMEMCNNERTKLADYSFVFRKLQKENQIYSDISEKSFRDFLFNEFEITLDKLKILEYCTTQTKETLYNIVKS